MGANSMKREFVVSAVALAASACVPIPRSYQVEAPVEGVVLQGQHPMSGVTVGYVPDIKSASCENPMASVVTDSNGRFSFTGTKGFLYWVALAPVEYGHSFRLCLRGPTLKEVSWVGRYFNGPHASSLVSVTCAIGKSEVCKLDSVRY